MHIVESLKGRIEISLKKNLEHIRLTSERKGHQRMTIETKKNLDKEKFDRVVQDCFKKKGFNILLIGGEGSSSFAAIHGEEQEKLVVTVSFPIICNGLPNTAPFYTFITVQKVD
ncbi:MAG: hypothetical protein WC514_01770 [Candidatus Paceibacterota bacterium]